MIPCPCGSGKKFKKCHGTEAYAQLRCYEKPAGPSESAGSLCLSCLKIIKQKLCLGSKSLRAFYVARARRSPAPDVGSSESG